MDNAELLSWSVLYTLGGASLVSFHIVQSLKDLVEKWIPVRIFSVLVAFAVLGSATAVVQGASASSMLLAFFNAFIVAYITGKQFDDAHK